jgi:nucleoside-diphosphate-sugar epimerase
VVDACKRVKKGRLIHLSSIHVNAQFPQDQPPDKTRAYVSDKAYAYDRSKAAGKQIVLQAVTEGLDAVILNPTGIVSPFDVGTSYTGNSNYVGGLSVSETSRALSPSPSCLQVCEPKNDLPRNVSSPKAATG